MATRFAVASRLGPGLGRLAFLVLPLLAITAGPVRAQFTGDPFDPYRNAYRSSSVPAYSNIGPLSGGYRFAQPPGVGFTTGLGDVGPEVPFLSGLNTSLTLPRGAGNLAPNDPFGLPSRLPTGSDRGQTTGYDRSYRANASVDPKYYEQVRARDALYFKALDESDPTKRAELLRQFRQASREANLRLSATPGSRRGTESVQARPRTTSPRRPGGPPDPTRPVGTPTDNTETVTTYQEMLNWSRVLDRMVLQDMQPPKP